ncbi:MAG: pilin [Candidatus Altiarchaeota archaeon]
MRRLAVLILLLLIVSTGGCVTDDFDTFIADLTTLLEEMAQMICDLNEAVQLIVGVVGSFVIVLAGLKWVGSQDNPQERTKAKQMLQAVVVGFAIVASATFIVEFVLGSSCI